MTAKKKNKSNNNKTNSTRLAQQTIRTSSASSSSAPIARFVNYSISNIVTILSGQGKNINDDELNALLEKCANALNKDALCNILSSSELFYFSSLSFTEKEIKKLQRYAILFLLSNKFSELISTDLELVKVIFSELNKENFLILLSSNKERLGLTRFFTDQERPNVIISLTLMKEIKKEIAMLLVCRMLNFKRLDDLERANSWLQVLNDTDKNPENFYIGFKSLRLFSDEEVALFDQVFQGKNDYEFFYAELSDFYPLFKLKMYVLQERVDQKNLRDMECMASDSVTEQEIKNILGITYQLSEQTCEKIREKATYIYPYLALKSAGFESPLLEAVLKNLSDKKQCERVLEFVLAVKQGNISINSITVGDIMNFAKSDITAQDCISRGFSTQSRFFQPAEGNLPARQDNFRKA